MGSVLALVTILAQGEAVRDVRIGVETDRQLRLGAYLPKASYDDGRVVVPRFVRPHRGLWSRWRRSRSQRRVRSVVFWSQGFLPQRVGADDLAAHPVVELEPAERWVVVAKEAESCLMSIRGTVNGVDAVLSRLVLHGKATFPYPFVDAEVRLECRRNGIYSRTYTTLSDGRVVMPETRSVQVRVRDPSQRLEKIEAGCGGSFVQWTQSATGPRAAVDLDVPVGPCRWFANAWGPSGRLSQEDRTMIEAELWEVEFSPPRRHTEVPLAPVRIVDSAGEPITGALVRTRRRPNGFSPAPGWGPEPPAWIRGGVHTDASGHAEVPTPPDHTFIEVIAGGYAYTMQPMSHQVVLERAPPRVLRLAVANLPPDLECRARAGLGSNLSTPLRNGEATFWTSKSSVTFPATEKAPERTVTTTFEHAPIVECGLWQARPCGRERLRYGGGCPAARTRTPQGLPSAW